jgi:coproporphyrinogen III oxidase-like Fe-S oxidoreductase
MVYRGPDHVTAYLRYLAREGELYRAALEDTEVVIVYFGGGTTNLYLRRRVSAGFMPAAGSSRDRRAGAT